MAFVLGVTPLPLTDCPAVETGERQERDIGRSLRILLAEDNPVNQLVVSESLTRAGHRVQVVENGKLAVAALAGELFDLAFMDVHMPEMDGFAALARVRETEFSSGRHLPIIALTANAMKGDRERCLHAGFDDYVPKPIRFGDLFAALERHVPSEQAQSGDAPAPYAIDRERLLAHFERDEDLARKTADMFLRNCSRWLGDIRRAISVGDVKKLHMSAHSLKGAVGHFTEADPYRLSVQLEQSAKRDDLTTATHVLPALETALLRLQRSLREALALPAHDAAVSNRS